MKFLLLTPETRKNAGRRSTFICMLILLYFAYFNPAFSQKADSEEAKLMNSSIPQTPDAAALAKYGNIPVSYYTGVPNISVPIYTIKEGDIELPISISYHASGIRVDEEASWVGLGWALNAGGVITRQIMGRDDFTGQGYLFGGQGYFLRYFDNEAPEVPQPAIDEYLQTRPILKPEVWSRQSELIDLTDYLGLQDGVPYDFEPDVYTFNFNGYSGKFIVKRTGEVMLQSKDLIKIECSTDQNEWLEDISMCNGNKWKVTTKDGYRYLFESSESFTDTEFYPDPVNTAWYLTKIISPTNREIRLYYKSDDINANSPGEYIQQRVGAQFGIGEEDEHGEPYCRFYQTTDQFYIDKHPNQKDAVRLSLDSIGFTHGRVVFNSDEDRKDLIDGRKLNSVYIYKKDLHGNIESQPSQKYVFVYDYFTSLGQGGYTPTNFVLAPEKLTEILTLRLRLNSLREFSDDNVENKVYEFDYYDELPLQLPSKNSCARDYWGYYNGRALNNNIEGLGATLIPEFAGFAYNALDPINGSFRDIPGANRQPDENYTAAFSLKSIKYPTKGSTEFIYEGHDFDMEKSTKNDMSTGANVSFELVEVGPVNLGELIKDPNDLNKIHELPPIDAPNAFIVPTQTHAVGQIEIVFLTSNIWKNLNITAIQNSDDYVEIVDIDLEDGQETVLGSFYLRNYQECLDNESCRNGSNDDGDNGEGYLVKTLDFPFDPNRNIVIRGKVKLPELNRIQVSLKYNTRVDQINSLDHTASAGGLRIAKIIDNDLINGKTNHREFKYNFNYDIDDDGETEIISSGVRRVRPFHFRYTREYSELDVGYLTLGGVSLGACGTPESPQVNKEFCYLFLTSSQSNVGNAGANGVIVGYDSVSVLYGRDDVNGYGVLGKTTYKYENEPDQVFDYYFMRAPGIPNLSSNRNGLLTEQVDYKYDNGNYAKIREVKNNFGASKFIERYYGCVIEYKKIDQNLFNCPIDVYQPFVFIYPALQSEWIQLKSTEEKTWDLNGNTTLTTKTDYTYEDTPLHYQVKETATTHSDGKITIASNYYPLDFPLGDNIHGAVALKQRFMHNIPLEQTVSIGLDNGESPKEISKQISEFTEKSGLAVPTTITTYPSGSSGPEKKVFLDYDDAGNIISEHKEHDIITRYIWGFNKSRVLAKIEGDENNEAITDLDQILVGLGYANGIDDLNDIEDENDLVAIFNQLRSDLPNIYITSYTYDTSKGVTTITDVNGIKARYNYDEFGRLSNIQDKEDNIIRRLEYQYKVE